LRSGSQSGAEVLEPRLRSQGSRAKVRGLFKGFLFTLMIPKTICNSSEMVALKNNATNK